uniref:NADP-dependent oxidoreductase domain-containing protein n=1 Tax=Cyprinus carpio TaxID=7962 RepID=A0A8C1NPS2_CYPCA
MSPSVLLNTGTLMPLLGLGTFRLQSQEDSYNAVGAALTAGYHVFDTAAICHNEAQLGHALRRLLPKHDLSQEDGSKATDGCLRSLEQLGLSYIDLCLIHTQGLPAGDKQNYWLLGFLITH